MDVIESNYSVLEQRIAAAQDFWEAERAHERYLHNLVTQSFLSHASLCRQFGEVFGQARDLCQLVAQARANGVDWGRVKVCLHVNRATQHDIAHAVVATSVILH